MEIAIIIALILLNGVFAMSEIALISARKSSLSNDIRHGSSTARIALKLANDPDKFLSTIQIGITLIGILTGIYSGDVLATDFGNILTDAGHICLFIGSNPDCHPGHLPHYYLWRAGAQTHWHECLHPCCQAIGTSHVLAVRHRLSFCMDTCQKHFTYLQPAAYQHSGRKSD